VNHSLPNAKSAHAPDEREKLRRVILQRNLVGLANDTKWDELIDAMRARRDWRPSYRFQCIDGPPSDWDVEWFYHLPFPMISVEWLDVSTTRVRGEDHPDWIEVLIRGIGLDYRAGTTMIRIFGYSPRSFERFDD